MPCPRVGGGARPQRGRAAPPWAGPAAAPGRPRRSPPRVGLPLLRPGRRPFSRWRPGGACASLASAPGRGPAVREARDLLAAVCAAPEDDDPRLVYADWLEEHGQAQAQCARAEFIRLQIALAR